MGYFIFRSFKSKILFIFVALTAAVLGAVTLMTWRNFELEVAYLHKQLLRNLLKTVTNIVATKYDGLVKDELDNIASRRQLMEFMMGSVLAALKSDYSLYQSGILSEDDAKRKSLEWVQHVRYGDRQYFFVCDMDMDGLSHPITDMIGRRWEGFKDLKQRDALPLMRDVIQRKQSGYTVLEWPALPEMTVTRQMAYFSYLPEWQWMVGTSVRIDDLDKDYRGKIELIRTDLGNILPSIKIGEPEQVFLFDSKGEIIVHQGTANQHHLPTNDDPAFRNTIPLLMDAAKDPGTPIRHACFFSHESNHTLITYVDHFRPLDWYIAVSTSDATLSAPVNQLVQREVLIIMGILVIGTIMAVFISNRMTSRLLFLARYTRELPAKDLAAEKSHPLSDLAGGDSDDEIGQLIWSFRTMETELRETMRALTWESGVNSALADLSEALIQSMPVDDISLLVLDRARQLTGSQHGFVAYVDQFSGHLICPTLTGDIWEQCQVENKRCVFESFTGLWGWVLTHRKPLISNSPAVDPRSEGVPPGHVPITRFLSSPALIGDTLVGQIALANPERKYTQQDLALVERLASLYALAIHRKHTEETLAHSEEQLRLLSTQRLITQEEERRKIARELHDSIGQSLAAIKFNVENVLGKIDRERDASVTESLEMVIPIIRNAMEEARRIYTGLRPTLLDDLGVIATLSWFCREFGRTYRNICVEFQLDLEEGMIPEQLKIVIFRIVQEALNNIARHSRAELVNLDLARNDGRIELTVEDNGTGFDLDAALAKSGNEKGLGIAGMKERTELAGGSFSIKSIPGEGTVIHAIWPVKGTCLEGKANIE